jgi:hypothetical protein
MQDQVVGTWKLESFEIEDQSGLRRPWGKAANGLLIYTDTGKMSVSINRQIELKSENQIENKYDSILFYSGSFSVEDNRIIHQVTNASNPDRIGKSLIRFAKLDQNKLSLSSPLETFGTAHLVWVKEQQ